MTVSWIVAAHASGARVLMSEGPGRDMTLVADLAHPEGRMHPGDLVTDNPGQGGDSVHGPHAMSSHSSVHDAVADRFAREVAEVLDRGRNANRFSKLYLIAPPRFLGMLRHALTDPTKKLVAGELAANAPDASPKALRAQLADIARI